MINSTMLPRVMFNSAPKATPIRSEIFSVVLVRIPVSGIIAIALRVNVRVWSSAANIGATRAMGTIGSVRLNIERPKAPRSSWSGVSPSYSLCLFRPRLQLRLRDRSPAKCQ